MTLAVNAGLLQVFDVEHGSCALLTVPNGMLGYARWMIDCGHNSTTSFYPGNHLSKLGVTALQHLLVTNFDEDHASGYPNLLARGIDVEYLSKNPTVSAQDIRRLKSEDGMGVGIDALAGSFGNFSPCAPGKYVPLPPGVTYEVYFNTYPTFTDENNLSMVVALTVHGLTFLFPGDMECAGFKHLLAMNPFFARMLPKVDVFIASHHGRTNGICEEMFSRFGCRPKIVVISDDYKQYETQESTSWYAARCIGIPWFRNQGQRKVLTTRSDGEITFSFNTNLACTVA